MKSDLTQRVQALADRPTIARDDLSSITGAILAQCGVPDADAATVADVLTDAQLRGSQSHGVMHLPAYVRGLLGGAVNPRPRFDVASRRDGALVIDADRGIGVLVGIYAIDRLTPHARRNGIAAAAVRNSNHFGVAGYFTERAADQGMICLVFSNASPTMAPYGAVEAMLGTNPIAAGFPLPGAASVIMDMSTSIVARGRIRQAARAGTSIPSDWALDEAGRPTTDPTAALKGTIQPMAGAKGYGLALMAELLCSTLSDGRPGYEVSSPHEAAAEPSGVSHFFLLIDPEGFCGAQRQGERASAVATRINAAASADGLMRARLPGARGHAARRKALAEGIAITPALTGALMEAAKQLDAQADLKQAAAESVRP